MAAKATYKLLRKIPMSFQQHMSFVYLPTHLFNPYLLNILYKPGTVRE